MTERLHFHFSLSCIGEGNGNPLQCSCLENPRGGVAWWAAVYGVAQSRTRLKRLSSSSSSPFWGTQSSVPVFWTINYLDIWDSTLESKTSEGHKEPHHTAPPSPGHTHTHTHTLISLFSLGQSFEEKGKLHLAVWIRQGFWQPTFNFHLSSRVLTRFWRGKLSRILKKKFLKWHSLLHILMFQYFTALLPPKLLILAF